MTVMVLLTTSGVGFIPLGDVGVLMLSMSSDSCPGDSARIPPVEEPVRFAPKVALLAWIFGKRASSFSRSLTGEKDVQRNEAP